MRYVDHYIACQYYAFFLLSALILLKIFLWSVVAQEANDWWQNVYYRQTHGFVHVIVIVRLKVCVFAARKLRSCVLNPTRATEIPSAVPRVVLTCVGVVDAWRRTDRPSKESCQTSERNILISEKVNLNCTMPQRLIATDITAIRTRALCFILGNLNIATCCLAVHAYVLRFTVNSLTAPWLVFQAAHFIDQRFS
jgi:hypothetical protein